MKFKDNSKKIKKALLEGGLVVSGRGTGKTRALAEILFEIPNAVVIVGLHAQTSQLRLFLKEKGLSDYLIKAKVITAREAEKRHAFTTDLGFITKYFYVDELYYNPYKGPFKAATTSFPYPVKVIK